MSNAATISDVETWVIESIAATSEREPELIGRTTMLEELDVDSLDVFEPRTGRQAEFGVELKPNDMKDVRSVGDAIDAVTGALVTRPEVVVTGVGAVTPLGNDARTLHERWCAGDVAIKDGTGRCDEFRPERVMARKEARRMDRFTQLAVAAGDEALEDAGWGRGEPYPPERVGCIIGTATGGLASMEQQLGVLREQGPGAVSPFAVPLMMCNAAVGTLAIRYKLGGHAYAIVSACAAGAHAIGASVRMIQAGDADAVVTGGSEASLTALALAAFANMGALSPSGVSRPFDARRDGFVMGEGAGVLVLERRDTAEARGAHIHGAVLGYGSTDDAHHLTAPEPGGDSAARAMRLALSDAGVAPQHVDYVNAHGTATPLNDRTETRAIKRVLGAAAGRVPVSSTKSTIGHLVGAAGAVEAIATLLALRDRVAPPTLGWEQAEDDMDLDYVPGRPRPLAVRDDGDGPSQAVALSNSFGFGGHNVVLCLAGAA